MACGFGRKKMCQTKFAKILGISVLILLLVACYKADTSTSFFGKEENVCVGEDCEEMEKHFEDYIEDIVVDKEGGGRETFYSGQVSASERDGDSSRTQQESQKLKKADGAGENTAGEDEQNAEADDADDEAARKNDAEAEETTQHLHAAISEPEEINVIITFTNAKTNTKLQTKFQLTVSSMMEHATIPLAIHIIGDAASQDIADNIIGRIQSDIKHRTVRLDVDQLAQDLQKIVKPMQDHFSYRPGAYYSHSLFFLSTAMHKVMPESMHRVIMLDADLKFMDDIKKLHDRFRFFSKESVMGIGHEMQPVYRHAYWKYRQANPGTHVGEPAPDGLPGFNSGVLLLNLDAMRRSQLYNSLITLESVEKLTEEYQFKGHLGDQDFFSLVAMKYEWLFHVLPCSWNRQLCVWWRDNGYKEVFHLYHDCNMEVKIYHGNCDTAITF